MASRWLSRIALTSAAAGAVLFAGGPAVWAADPGGNNGTVKIEAVEVNDDEPDDNPDNDPHVPCDFQLQFFNFDENQTADISFRIHPPSGDGGDVLDFKDDEVVSDDPAGGAGDNDAVIDYDASTWGLENFDRHPQQGYHVKLTIESEGLPGGKKHKVFWLDCEAPTEPPVTTEPPATTEPPTSPPTTTKEPELPVTGAALTGVVIAGLALVGGGTALLIMRRRRDALENPAEL